MRHSERFLAIFAIPAMFLIGWTSAAWAEDWPAWRGPRGDGSSREHGIPTEWDGPEERNVAWETALPGVGHASPIVWGDRIFLASCQT
jgi:outer membrane protein assembly factor BamB